MESADATPRAVAYSVLLHLGIVGFLALAMMNCASWEHFADLLHLPTAWRPVTCSTQVVQLQGPVIEATLVGPVGAPPPPATRRHQREAPPKQPDAKPAPVKPPPPANVRVLPTPVQQPALKDQEKIAQIAQQQAEQAQQAQQEEQRQRMAELTRQKEQERILKELAKVRAESEANQKQVRMAEQKAQQLADLSKASQNPSAQNVPVAKQAMSGQNGTSNAAYAAALTQVITQNWLRPPDIRDGTVCPVEIKQMRGGRVIDVTVLPSCPMSDLGKHSVEAAIRRSSPLPYKGFEKAFQSDIELDFRVTSSQ